MVAYLGDESANVRVAMKGGESVSELVERMVPLKVASMVAE